MKNDQPFTGEIIDNDMSCWRVDLWVQQWGETKSIFLVSMKQDDVVKHVNQFYPKAKVQNIAKLFKIEGLTSSVVLKIIDSPRVRQHMKWLEGQVAGLPKGVAPADRKDEPKDFSEINRWNY